MAESIASLNSYDSSTFVSQIDSNSLEVVDPIDFNNGNNFNAIFKQYEKVVVTSLVTAFGLDFLLFNDKVGGDVDTIHNARNGIYADDSSRQAYLNRGEYNKSAYDNDDAFRQKNNAVSQAKKSGNLEDAYTGKRVARNADIDLDHEIPTKEIHDDPGRILPDMDGIDLANADTNLNPTDRSINRSQKAKSATNFIKWLENTKADRQKRIVDLHAKGNLSDQERKELNKLEKLESVDPEMVAAADKKAREDYNRKINSTYYSSTKFLKSTTLAAGKQAAKMGVKQVLGLFFAEVWFSIKEEFPVVVAKLKDDFSIKELLEGIANVVKRAVEKIKNKYKEIIAAFKDGIIAGAIASISSTVINIFSTTAKNAGRILRNTWSSIVEALKVLIINPDNLPLGEQLKATAKILGTGISIVCGSLIQEAISQLMPKIPILADVIPTFLGTLVTGLLSVSFLFFMDNSKTVAKIVEWVNQYSDYAALNLQYYKEVNAKLNVYLSQLLLIDVESINRESEEIHKLNQALVKANSNCEMALILKQEIALKGIKMPYEDIDTFMSDENAILIF